MQVGNKGFKPINFTPLDFVFQGGCTEVHLLRGDRGVKIVRPRFDSDRETAERLLRQLCREALITTTLSQATTPIPTLIPGGGLVPCQREDGKMDIGLQLPEVWGKSADAILATEAFEPIVALKIVRDVLLAFVALHEHGIIHHDVKPGNIIVLERSVKKPKVVALGRGDWSRLKEKSYLINEGTFDHQKYAKVSLTFPQLIEDFDWPGENREAIFALLDQRAVLIDLGSAYRLTDNDKVPLSTPGYQAPELILAGLPTPASDLYSLALSLYELLTWKVPIKLGKTDLISWLNMNSVLAQHQKFHQRIEAENFHPLVANLLKRMSVFDMSKSDYGVSDRLNDAREALTLVNQAIVALVRGTDG